MYYHNTNEGTLDTLLVKCADSVYADLKTEAEAYLNHVDSKYKEKWGPFVEQKALVATVTSVLQPGSTNTVSIARDNWLCAQTLADSAEVAAFSRFLHDLLGLSPC